MNLYAASVSDGPILSTAVDRDIDGRPLQMPDHSARLPAVVVEGGRKLQWTDEQLEQRTPWRRVADDGPPAGRLCKPRRITWADDEPRAVYDIDTAAETARDVAAAYREGLLASIHEALKALAITEVPANLVDAWTAIEAGGLSAARRGAAMKILYMHAALLDCGGAWVDVLKHETGHSE